MVNLSNTNKEKYMTPNLNNISRLTKTTIKENFEKYGNSWMDKFYCCMFFNDRKWWEKRLLNEVNELKKCKSDGEMREKLLDVLAVASLMLDNLHRQGDFIWNDKMWRYS